MYLISELSRRSGMPRRTVQFWADNGALIPAEPGRLRKRALYDETELDIVCMLRPFAQMAAPISVVRALAGYFRDWLTGKMSDEHGPPAHQTLAAARAGEPVYFAVSILNGDVMAYATVMTEPDVGYVVNWLLQQTHNPLAPVVVIDLTASLRREGLSEAVEAQRATEGVD